MSLGLSLFFFCLFCPARRVFGESRGTRLTTQECRAGKFQCADGDCVSGNSGKNVCRCWEGSYAHQDTCSSRVPSVIVERPYWGRSEVEEGSPVTLRCDPGTDVPHHVVWLRNDRQVALGAKLSIPSFGDQHTGRYSCYAVGSLWESPESAAHPLYLTGAPPTPTVTLDPRVVTFGAMASLTCHSASGQVAWFKDGWLMADRMRPELQLSPLTFIDTGSYACQVKVAGKSSLHSWALDVGSKIMLTPEVNSDNLTIVPPGSTVTLRCSLSSFAPGTVGWSYQWFHTNLTGSRRQLAWKAMTHTVTQFWLDDVGDYTCKIIYNGPSQESKLVKLRLTVGVPRLYATHGGLMLIGQPGVMSCAVCPPVSSTGGTFPLTWSRLSGDVITSLVRSGTGRQCSTSRREFISHHQITPRALDHGEVIVCSATFGGKTRRANITLNVVSHPTTLYVTGSNKGIARETGSWSCVVDGGNFVAPSVLWTATSGDNSLPPDAAQTTRVENYTRVNTSMPVIRVTATLTLTLPWKPKIALTCNTTHVLPDFGLWTTKLEHVVTVTIPQVGQRLTKAQSVVTREQMRRRQTMTIGITAGVAVLALAVYVVVRRTTSSGKQTGRAAKQTENRASCDAEQADDDDESEGGVVMRGRDDEDDEIADYEIYSLDQLGDILFADTAGIESDQD